MDTSGYYPVLTGADAAGDTPAYTALLKQILDTRPMVAVGLATTDQVLGTTGIVERPIVWNERNPDKTMNPDGNRDRLVAPVAGWYHVEATLVFSNVANGQRSLGFQIYQGGVKTYLRGQNNLSPSASFFAELNGSATVLLAAGDYVKVTAEVQLAAASVSIKASQGTRAALIFQRPA